MLYTSPIPHTRSSGTAQIRADIYPADVHFSFADNPFNRARAIVTADEVIVLVEAGRPSVLYEGRLEDFNIEKTSLTATTVDGEITIVRANGCGCGSRLRNYKPFSRSVRMAVQ